ncbi:MAG: sulfite exporter TauE/SafE family protein [Desulfobacterales bacterium]
MDGVDIWGMFLLGLLGTGHCIGMCGPLIFAFPGRTGRLLPHLAYHLGRIATYTGVGAALGGIGQMMAGSGGDPGGVVAVKVVLWLVAASLLLVLGVARLGIFPEPRWLSLVAPDRIPGFKVALEGATSGRGLAPFLVLGLILGFLPCGLSYGAFANALGTASVLKGTASTLAFAVGTAPGLILLGTGASALFNRFRRQSDILAGVLMILMAVKMAHKAISMLGA